MKKPALFGRARARVRRIWRKWWVRLLLVLTLLGMAGGGLLWAKGKLERWQSRKLTAMATDYLREGKIEDSRMGVEAALKLNPSNAEALRLMARLHLSQGEKGSAFELFSRLADSGNLSLNDLTTYAKLAASLKYETLSEQLIDMALPNLKASTKNLLIAEICEAKNDPIGEEKALRRAVVADESGEAGFLLARFLTNRRLNAQTAPEVLEILRKTSGRNDQMGAEALALGISSGVVPPAEIEGWISSLRSHPKVNMHGLMLADAAEIRVRPETKSQVVDRLTQRLQGKPLAERVQGMALAIQVGEPQKASNLISPAEAASDGRVFQMWLDAMGLQNRWEEILEALGSSGQPLPEYLKSLYTGRALMALGKSANGERAYGKALQEAFPKREEFLVAVAYLGLAGEDDLFEQGLRKALEDPKGRTEVIKAVVPAVAGHLDAARTRRVYEIAASMPGAGGDLILQNNLDYLALVLGKPVDIRVLAERSRANPREFSLRVTHALALLRAGNAKQALKELEDCEPDVVVELLPPHQKAVVATALALNGRENEAKGALMTMPPMSLSKQEAEFLVACFKPYPRPTAAPAKASEKKTAPKK